MSEGLKPGAPVRHPRADSVINAIPEGLPTEYPGVTVEGLAADNAMIDLALPKSVRSQREIDKRVAQLMSESFSRILKHQRLVYEWEANRAALPKAPWYAKPRLDRPPLLRY